MDDLVPPAEGPADARTPARKMAGKDQTEISWNNSFQDIPHPLEEGVARDNWSVTMSPHGAFTKNSPAPWTEVDDTMESIGATLQATQKNSPSPEKSVKFSQAALDTLAIRSLSYAEREKDQKDTQLRPEDKNRALELNSRKKENQDGRKQIEKTDRTVSELFGRMKQAEQRKDDKTNTQEQKIHESGALKGKAKMTPSEKQGRKNKLEDESKVIPKKGQQKGGKVTCQSCGAAIFDAGRSVCRSCSIRVAKAKPKQPTNSNSVDDVGSSVSTSSISKDLLPEESYSTDTAVLNRSQSLDCNDTADQNLTQEARPPKPKRTVTDLGINAVNVANFKKDIMKTRDTTGSSSRSSVVEATSGISIQSEKMSTTRVEDMYQLSSSKKTMSRPSMKRSTTDSQIIHKPNASKNKKPTDATKGQTSIGSQLLRNDDIKKKGTSKEINAKTGKSKRESSETQLAMQEKTSSPKLQNETNVKAPIVKLERNKSTVGKTFYHDRDKKMSTEPDGLRKRDNTSLTPTEASASDKDEKTTSADPKFRRFLNSGRAHTTIGDGNQRRIKLKSESTRLRLDKKDNSPASEFSKDSSKKDSPAGGEMLKDAEKTGVYNTLLLNTASRLPVMEKIIEEDESSSDSEEESEVCGPTRQQSPDSIHSPGLQQRRNEPVRNRMNPLTSDSLLVRTSRARWMEESYSPQLVFGPSIGYGAVESDEGQYKLAADEDDETEWEGQPVQTQSQSSVIEYCDFDDKLKTANDESPTINNYALVLPSEVEENEDGGQMVLSGDCVYFGEDISYGGDVFSIPEEKDIDEQIYSPQVEDGVIYFDANLTLVPQTASFHSEIGEENALTPPTFIHPAVGAAWTESIYTGDNPIKPIGSSPVQQPSRPERTYLCNFETDVDTGAVMSTQKIARPQNSPPKRANEWGLYSSDSNSSISTTDGDGTNESWYTGGQFGIKGSPSTTNKDDLVYFNDKAAHNPEDSDVYTGDLFSNTDQDDSDCTNTTKNNSSIHESLSATNNLRNISSCPQIHQSEVYPQSKMDESGGQEEIPCLIDDDCDGELAMIATHATAICNVSNNYNGYCHDDEEVKSKSSKSRPQSSPKRSDYTEYPHDIRPRSARKVSPVREVEYCGLRDFSKYDRPKPTNMNNEQYKSPEYLTFRKDSTSYPSPTNKKPFPHMVNGQESTLYFKEFNLIGNQSGLQSQLRCQPVCNETEFLESGFGSLRDYDCDNMNNNADFGYSDIYTGCFKNEEELKDAYVNQANKKPSAFVYQQIKEVHASGSPAYFRDRGSKSYYDTEESDYAFEKREKRQEKRLPQLYKVGGIIVRDNVECEVDYARNINMDLQEQPKPWVRYDAAGEVDTSNYAQNVSYEELPGLKPWVAEESRTPWKDMETDAAHSAKPKSKSGSENKVVKSVKSLGTYVRKWF